MFRKGLAKKITTVITAAMLAVMAVVPAMAADKEDDGLIHAQEIGSITSDASRALASKVTMSKEKYPDALLYCVRWENDFDELFSTTESIKEQLGNSYKEGTDVELIGLVSLSNKKYEDTFEFNVSDVKFGEKVKTVVVTRVYDANVGKVIKKVYVTDTAVKADNIVDVTMDRAMFLGLKSTTFACAFIKVTGDTDEPVIDVPDTEQPEFSEDAKLTDEDGNEVKAEDVKSVVTALDETKTAEVKETLAKNDVTIAEDATVDYVDIKLNDSNNKVVVLSNGKVVVTVPAKENMSADKYTVKVYHIKADGTMETVPAELTSEGVKITATSFSPYVIVYEAKASTEAPSTSKDDISTGDSMMVIYAAFAMVLALAGAAAYSKKRA